MHIDSTDPSVVVVENRPLFVPGFGLLFVVVGLWQTIESLVSGAWSRDDVFGIVACLLMGGGLFLYTARRDRYCFDARAGELIWTRGNLFGTNHGSMPLTEIERVAVHHGPESDSTTYRVVLHSTRLGLLPLTPDYTAGEEHHRDVARAIETVLSR